MSPHLVSHHLSEQFHRFERELLRRVTDLEKSTEETLEFAGVLNNLAVVYHAQGRFTDADATHKRSLRMLQRLSGPVASRAVAQSLANRAALYRSFGEFHEAERLFQLAMRIWNREGWPEELEMKHNLEELLPSGKEMLWAEVIEKDGMLRFFGGEVERLRRSHPELLQNVVVKLGPWYHDIPVTPEISTNPSNRQYMEGRWRFVSEFLPEDLTGKSVLDIGCNAGFFALEMKRRNARRVVGIDIMVHCLAQSRFVSHWFRQPLDLRELGVYDVETLGAFDIVIFVGVLYHLRHPLYALDKIAAVCKDTMYLQSMLRGDMRDFEPAANYDSSEQEVFKRPEFPRLYFIEKSFNGDSSNWWIPNSSCLKAMARAAGFRSIHETSHPEVLVCKK